MQSIGVLQTAEQKVLHDIKALVANLRVALKNDPKDVCDAAMLLSELRKLCYEDLNQIQHEYLILQTISWLTRTHIVAANVTWKWNPRQTGTSSEPDLEAARDGNVTLSAEVTTSERPVGTIRARMLRTLRKLSAMPGIHYYVVKNSVMAKAAERFALDACPDARIAIINDDILAKRHLVVPIKAVQDVNFPYPPEPDFVAEIETETTKPK